MSAVFSSGGRGARFSGIIKEGNRSEADRERAKQQVEEHPSTVSYWSNQELSNLQQQRMVVEQLRREASIKRQPISEVVEEIKQFIEAHEQEDYLLIGFTSQKANPFREKSSCDII
ncbi:unnamed protein product [Meganyctiphanes norvegica]|uniref:G protein gamma domain-containing protein n=1 Tax=Meganyctiphanes norvegica TaxID=48144 RepID=A0AAV2Q063_MEGNR